MNVLNGLEPSKVFDFFELVSSVPRGSGNIKEISSLCVEVAKNRGMNVFRDINNNVIIYKEATKGYENVPPVIIQGHLDMVCNKNADVKIDMSREPIRLLHDDKYIYADGTTLGGDDGIALAYGLALIDSKDIKHPALEIVFTADEETGMDGAAGINPKLLSGRMLLNIDSEKEGVFTCGCAGGCRVNGNIPVNMVSLDTFFQNGSSDPGVDFECVDISLLGLKGGHSGAEIDRQPASANYLLGRVLYELYEKVHFFLSSLSGGEFDNVISEKSYARIIIKKNKEDLVRAFLDDYDKELKLEYSYVNPDIRLWYTVTEEESGKYLCVSEEDALKVLKTIYLSFQGVIEMSMELKGMVQTSQNLGAMKLGDSSFEIGYLVRSSVEGQKKTAVNRLKTIIELFGGKVKLFGNYPGWKYRNDSPLREACVRSFEKIYGYKPKINTIHAGLECGLFVDKLCGLDAVSFGPDILDIHTPMERLDIESVGRVWRLLLDILENMNYT